MQPIPSSHDPGIGEATEDSSCPQGCPKHSPFKQGLEVVVVCKLPNTRNLIAQFARIVRENRLKGSWTKTPGASVGDHLHADFGDEQTRITRRHFFAEFAPTPP